MKIKTSELTVHALDWAVAKCEEPRDNRLTVIRHEDYIGHPIEREDEPQSYTYVWWSPSRIWSQGGPIIAREKIGLDPFGTTWIAHPSYMPIQPNVSGPTPLIAAMRCYVASKLGDVVDIPEELQ